MSSLPIVPPEIPNLPYYLPGTDIQLAGFSHVFTKAADRSINTVTLLCSIADLRACPVCRRTIQSLRVEPIEDLVFEVSYKLTVDPERTPPTRFELSLINVQKYIYQPCGCEVPIAPAPNPE